MNAISLSDSRTLVKGIGLVLLLLAPWSIQAAEISTNGTGGGPWSDPATWRGNRVPARDDDVVVRKFDTASVDRPAACQKLQIDPRGLLQFKTGSGMVPLDVAAGIENFGVIKMDGTRSIQDDFTIRLIGASADKRQVKLGRGAGLLFYGNVKARGGGRNVALAAPNNDLKNPAEQPLILVDGQASIDWQWARIEGIKLSVQKLDNTGAKANERIQVLDCLFEGGARLECHSCDTPVISRNQFDYKGSLPIAEPALSTLYSPLSEIKGNRVRGKFAVGIAINYQTDSALTDNAVEGCGIGIHAGHGIANLMIKGASLKDCEIGLRLEDGNGVVEDVVVDGAKQAIYLKSITMQLTNAVVKNLDPKGTPLELAGAIVSMLNCDVAAEAIKVRPGAKASEAACHQYVIVAVAGAPEDSLVEVRSIDPKRPAEAADPHVRNSPAAVRMGHTPGLRSVNPLVVRAWTVDAKGAKVAGPEYALRVLGPAKEGETRPELHTMRFRPPDTAYRASPEDESPTLKVVVK